MKLGYTVEIVFIFEEAPGEEYHVEEPKQCLFESEARKIASKLEEHHRKALGNPYPIYAFNRYCGNGKVQRIIIRLTKFNKCFFERVIVA